MKQVSPRVQDGLLMANVSGNSVSAPVWVGSTQWFAWLNQASMFIFAFADVDGRFTARKEQRDGKVYWYTYIARDGHYRRTYLGRSADLTTKRLHDIANMLQQNMQVRAMPKNAVAAPLLTKLTVPPTRLAQLVPTRAFARMRQCDDFPLTVISAPAGSGKTTLLAQWASTWCKSMAWVSLDVDDSDSARFWTYILTALDPWVPGLLPLMLPKVQRPDAELTDEDLAQIINLLAAAPDSITLALDDYHVIADDAKIHQALAFLIGHLPANAHIILASRNEPPLPLAHYRAHAQVNEVRMADLRFTAESAAHFLKLAGTALAEDEVSELDQHLEGWITGWQLVALSLQRAADRQSWIAAFNGGHRYIMDFLADEVLKAVPEETVTFLQQTSVLRRLTAPLCDAVTGSRQSKEILLRLRRTNLFIEPLDDHDCWFRYHSLFSEMLRNRLMQRSADEIAELYQRASVWCEKQGHRSEAIEYARLGHDFNHAANIIEAEAEHVIARGELDMLRCWLDMLPEDIVRQRARLSMLRAYIAVSFNQREGIERALHDADEKSEQIDQPNHALFQSEMLALQAMLAAQHNKPQRCLALCQQSLADMPPDHAFRLLLVLDIGLAYYLAGDVHNAGQKLEMLRRQSDLKHNVCYSALSSMYLAGTRFLAGRLRESLALYRQIEAQFPTYDIAIDVSRVLYEMDDLPAASQYAKRGIDQSQTAWNAVMGYSVLADIYQAQSDAAGALLMIERALATARESDVTLTAYVQAQQARLWMAQENLAMASQWAEEYRHRHESDQKNVNIALYERITMALVTFHEGKFHETLTMLASLQDDVETLGLFGQDIVVMTLQALVHEALGNMQDASAIMRRAIALGKPEGFVHAFSDCGIAVKALLVQMRSERGKQEKHAVNGETVAYLDRILQAFATTTHPPVAVPVLMNGHIKSRPESQPLIDPLSSREIEVLQLLAAGASNRILAQRLVIAVGTVKRHLSNIFLKLGVQSRTQAIARAIALQIIEM